MTVLIIGATGSIARPVLDTLAAKGVPVAATSRNPARASLPDGVRVHRVDMATPETLIPALEGIEHVFLYINGITDPTAAATVLATHGRPHVVLISTYTAGSAGSEHDYNTQRHAVVEQALHGAGLPSTFLRAEAFASNTLGWAQSIRTDGIARMPSPGALIAPIHDGDLVEVAVAALTHDELIGSAPVLTGPQVLTQADQAHTIAQIIGRPVQVEELSRAEAQKFFNDFYSPELTDSLLDLWRNATASPPQLTNAVQDITGHPARTFREWVDEHRHQFS